MTDRPIVFSAPMIRALLDGRKTQTRRVVKIKDQLADHTFTGDLVDYYGNGRLGMVIEGSTLVQPIPYSPEDRLWVRETVTKRETDQGVGYQTYAACDTEVYPLTRWYHGRKSIPSIHMPRWASRLTLTITDVRVQRLQEISERDAKLEGLHPRPNRDGSVSLSGTSTSQKYITPTYAFRDLWNSMHGPDAWFANPWVVALTFDVYRCNIDQMDQDA